MRIAQLAPPYEVVPPAKYGGTERVISILTEELVRRGHEVTLFASGDSSTAARLVPVIDRALWHHDRYQEARPFEAIAVDEVYRRAGELDIIHNHDQLLAFPAARLRPDTPTVTTLHGRLDLPELQPFFRHFADMPLVSISHAQRKPLPHANWLATIHHGVRLEDFPFEPRAGGYLAFLGRIAPEKGLDTAIRVARRAGVPLKIAARLPLPQPHNGEAQRDWQYYQEIIQPLLREPGIEYVGELGDAEKATLLAGALALLFPIRWPEPFGLVMIEALACGTPVLALRGGSTPEVVDHGRTGFVVDDELGLERAVEDVGRVHRGACRATAEERFSVAAMAERYERVYSRLLGGTREPEAHHTASRVVEMPAGAR